MLTIRLIGPPTLERDGSPVPPPRGAKSWALLAVLLTAEAPPSRQRLATLLFPEADNPLAALRWNLSVLRGALGPSAALLGDPVTVELAPGDRVDVALLRTPLGEALRDDELLRLGGQLLEGLIVQAGPAFDSWLLVTRLALQAGCRAVLHDAALHRLSTGRPHAAAALVARALELDPHSADDHALVVRALLSAGDTRAAARHVERCRRIFRDDLGADLPDVVLRASRRRPAPPDAPSVAVNAVSAASYLEAGRASLGVGAVDAAEQQLRRAVEMARLVGDPDLSARALVTRAGGLIHGSGARGVDVAAMLHEGLAPLIAPSAGSAPGCAPHRGTCGRSRTCWMPGARSRSTQTRRSPGSGPRTCTGWRRARGCRSTSCAPWCGGRDSATPVRPSRHSWPPTASTTRRSSPSWQRSGAATVDTTTPDQRCAQALGTPAASWRTASVVRHWPPMPQSPLLTSSTTTQVTLRIASPSMDTMASVRRSTMCCFAVSSKTFSITLTLMSGMARSP